MKGSIPASVALALLSSLLVSCGSQPKPSVAPSGITDLEAGTPSPPARELNSPRIDEFIAEKMRSMEIPGLALAILDHGTVVKLKGYGLADLESRKPVDEDTVFRLASVTKPITAIAVLRLIEEGRVALEDHVADLLPDVPATFQAVTVHQLLDHTSGLPDLDKTNSHYPVPRTTLGFPQTLEGAMTAFKTNPPVSRPGMAFKYIETDYLLLGLLVEKYSGMPFKDYMDRQFFRQLGMTSTSYGDTAEPRPGHAVTYTHLRFDRGRATTRLPKIEKYADVFPDYLAPCATLRSSARDLARWDSALSTGRLLGPSSLAAMWKAGASTYSGQGVDRIGCGCGWRIRENRDGRLAFHSGADAVWYCRYLDEGLTIIVLTNCMVPIPFQFTDELRSIVVENRSKPEGNPPQ